MDLEVDDAPAALALRFRAAVSPATREAAERWLERGYETECVGDLSQARRAYERAIALDPSLAAAHFNLGNVLRGLGDSHRARLAFQRALLYEPDQALAWYNLADLHEEPGELETAIGCLGRALRIDPAFADAHFNLALCLERLERFEEAARHWSAYLRFDACSEWAAQARQALSALRTRSGAPHGAALPFRALATTPAARADRRGGDHPAMAQTSRQPS